MDINAELQYGKDEYPQWKIRVNTDGPQGIVMVGLDGWDYDKNNKREPDRWGRTTKGKQIRISSNQALEMTHEEFVVFANTVLNCYDVLEEIEHLDS